MKTEPLSDRLLQLLAHILPQRDRVAVLGDLQEDNVGFIASIIAILDLAIRKELTAWNNLRSRSVLLAVITPCALILGSVSFCLADQTSIYLWLFANNIDLHLLQQPGFWRVFSDALPQLCLPWSAVICWSFCCGVVIGRLLQKPLRIGVLPVCAVFCALWLGWRPLTLDMQTLQLARDFAGNAAVFQNSFYRFFYAPILYALLVLVPMVYGSRVGILVQLRHRTEKLLWISSMGISFAALLAQATMWWQVRTWTTNTSVTIPHLPSAIPFAFPGAVAFVLIRLQRNSTFATGLNQ